jgi:hypothetical protein
MIADISHKEAGLQPPGSAAVDMDVDCRNAKTSAGSQENDMALAVKFRRPGWKATVMVAASDGVIGTAGPSPSSPEADEMALATRYQNSEWVAAVTERVTSMGGGMGAICPTLISPAARFGADGAASVVADAEAVASSDRVIFDSCCCR